MIETIQLATIVEGHGEVVALPILLRRLATEIEPSRHVEVLQPQRVKRDLAVKPGELERHIELASRRIAGRPGAVLVVLDGDDDCVATLGPALLDRARSARPDVPIAVVLPVCEFEAWFLAAAESLRGRRGLDVMIETPPDPESIRDAKGWLQRRRTDGRAYSPTVDQPALAAMFDIHASRTAAPSMDKLWRDVERILAEAVG